MTPSIRSAVTMARAPVRLSATVSSACRHNSGNSATTRPARCAASTVSTNSTVFGSCTAITELFGKPASMKCAASAEIARSAPAKVSRLGGCAVTRALLRGSSSASASGFRARTRRNNPSSVGEALFWITGSLRLSLRPLPPGFREIARQGGGLRPFYPIPPRDPLLLHAKHRDNVKARHQHPVQRRHRRDESGMLTRLQQGRDHGVDGGIPGAHVVSCTLDARRLAAPVEILLVARRQRLCHRF